MYLRFVLQKTNNESGVREGLFQTAYALVSSDDLSPDDRAELTDLLAWFKSNLKTPERFNRSTSKGYYRRATRGIAWLKPTATEQLDNMRALAALIGRYGHFSEMIKTERPGYVVYEDGAQIIAEPFQDTPT